MGRLTDDDKKFGPITYGRTLNWKPWRFVWSSGGSDDEGSVPKNDITIYAFGWVARIFLPNILKPWKIWVPTGHYEWAKSPDAGYWDIHAREYGFSLNDGFLSIFMGPQTHDSITTKSKHWHLPWTQWDHVRHSIYQPDGSEYWAYKDRDRGRDKNWWPKLDEAKKTVKKSVFLLDDYDGERITATCYIEEREWHFGTGNFRWLRFFRKPLIKRSLWIDFDKETGPEKGSWKGGTIGCGATMEKGDTPEAAMRCFCEEEHRSKHRPFKMKFVEAVV